MNSERRLHRCCPICEGDEPRPFWSKPSLQIVRCGNCALLYLENIAPQFASGQHYDSSDYHLWPDKLASDYSPVRFERELRIFREFCPGGEVLDVGCSTGAFLFQLQRRFPRTYSVTGVDVANAPLEAVQRARAAHVTVQRAVVAVTQEAIRVCGGRAFLKRYPLERYARDARAAALMRPWTQEIAMQQAWEAALGFDGQPGGAAGA